MIKAEDVKLCRKSSKFLCDDRSDLPRISHSSRNTFVGCRQAYYFYKVCGIRVQDKYKSIPLKLGTIWDDFIQHVYQDKKFGDKFNDYYIPKFELDDYAIVKIRAMCRAYKRLGIIHRPGGEFQAEVNYPTSICIVNGKLDVKYDNLFEEHKFSGSPDRYTKPHNIVGQIATYFLADKKLKECIMMVARNPKLYQRKGEPVDDYGERLYKDILSRPSFYFLGFDRATNTYGLRYFKDECEPLQSVLDDYDMVMQDLLRCEEEDRYYQTKESCFRFGGENACEYLDICESKKVDWDRYEKTKQ